MIVQLIEKKDGVFRLCINERLYNFIPVDLIPCHSFFPLKKTVKGSTPGWNLCDGFVSYWQIKKAILYQRNQIRKL